VDSPNISRYFKGADLPLPDICRGRVQLRQYSPLLPRYQAFQIINVYLFSGPDYNANRPILQALLKLSNTLPTFLVGDWNFIQRACDSSSTSYTLPPSDFSDLMNQVMDWFSVTELDHDSHTYFHISENKEHTRTSRLDRIYIPHSVSHSPTARPTASIYHHHSNFSLKRTFHLSDHIPVSITYADPCEHDELRPTIGRWLASSPEFKAAIKGLWKDLPIRHPYQTLKRYKETLFKAARVAQRSLHQSRSSHLRLSHHISLLNLIQQPQQKPNNISKLLKIYPQLHDLVKQDSTGSWLDNGLEIAIRNLLSETSTDLNPTKPKKRNIISSLSDSAPHFKPTLPSLRPDPDSPSTNDRDEMAEIAKDFWSNIWRKRGLDDHGVSSRMEFLNNYHSTVNLDLLIQPDLQDILDAICSPKNTCAGPDGISFAAWRAWPEASANVLNAVLNSICNGRLPPANFNQGLLFLLPKKQTGLINDTRPLSITNTDNRILASAMAKSSALAIRSLIHPAQKGFLSGVQGTEHIEDINSLFYGDRANGLERYVFFLDTAKAFDSIDHTWIHAVLKKAAFPLWFINFVKGSLNQVNVTPFFNGLTDTRIEITRGVKQGCPLSPLLFILAYDPLIRTLATFDNLSQHAYADDLAMTTNSIVSIYPALHHRQFRLSFRPRHQSCEVMCHLKP